MIGEDTLLRFSGVPLGEACSIIIRGATQQIVDEAERSLHDALCVLATTVRETKIVFGGGKSSYHSPKVFSVSGSYILRIVLEKSRYFFAWLLFHQIMFRSVHHVFLSNPLQLVSNFALVS